jgi:hypothetical protein
MADDELVVVYSAVDEVDALLHRTMLEEAGIDVEERPLEVEWLESVRQRGLHSQLLVRQEDVARATELIKSYDEESERGDLEADEDKGEA